jgi:hypothetical protein
MGDKWEHDPVYIIGEFDCKAIPGPNIDPETGAWKSPPPARQPGKQPPANGPGALPKAESEDEQPPQKSAG